MKATKAKIKPAVSTEVVQLEWNVIEAQIESELDCDIRDYRELDFWAYWVNNIDNDVTNDRVSSTRICLVDVLQNTREAIEELGEADEWDETDHGLIQILETMVEVLGDDAHTEVQFEYSW